MAPPLSHHHLVIVRREPDGGLSTLLLEGREGWTLPRLQSAERRSADVSDLTREAGDTLGLEVSVLQCLSDEPAQGERPRRQLYLLEAHGTRRETPGRWIPRKELEATVPPSSAARWALDAWLRATPSTSAGDWTQPGWRDEVLAWVDGQLARRGCATVRAVEQVRVWEWSQVLRLDAGEAQFYFKARPTSGAAEVPLTQRLAERHPAWMPEVIAVDPHRHWLLMREAPGRELMELGDLAHWEAAAAAIARMQIDWVGATGELAALGCPRWTLAQLAAQLSPLLDDASALQPGGEDSLTDAQVATLRQRRGELEALCRELDEHGVPESLEHGDFWAANVIAGDDAVVFLDWEDAAIAHPFITPSLLLLSVPYAEALADGAEARRRIREAYLTPWTERGPLAGWPPRRLERTFELAQQVAMLHYAVQFRRGLSAIETSRQVRGFLPFFLGRLLA
jgi:hypothetical protein